MITKTIKKNETFISSKKANIEKFPSSKSDIKMTLKHGMNYRYMDIVSRRSAENYSPQRRARSKTRFVLPTTPSAKRQQPRGAGRFRLSRLRSGQKKKEKRRMREEEEEERKKRNTASDSCKLVVYSANKPVRRRRRRGRRPRRGRRSGSAAALNDAAKRRKKKATSAQRPNDRPGRKREKKNSRRLRMLMREGPAAAVSRAFETRVSVCHSAVSGRRARNENS